MIKSSLFHPDSILIIKPQNYHHDCTMCDASGSTKRANAMERMNYFLVYKKKFLIQKYKNMKAFISF